MSIFSKEFWYVFQRVGFGYRKSDGIDKIFECAFNSKTLLVLDPTDEEEVRGLFLMHGIEIDLHILQGGQLIRHTDLGPYAVIYYPYNPMDYPDQMSYHSFAP